MKTTIFSEIKLLPKNEFCLFKFIRLLLLLLLLLPKFIEAFLWIHWIRTMYRYGLYRIHQTLHGAMPMSFCNVWSAYSFIGLMVLRSKYHITPCTHYYNIDRHTRAHMQSAIAFVSAHRHPHRICNGTTMEYNVGWQSRCDLLQYFPILWAPIEVNTRIRWVVVVAAAASVAVAPLAERQWMQRQQQ